MFCGVVRRQEHMRDREVVDAFVAATFAVWTSWTTAHDAVAGSFAIEHTSTDVVADQRTEESWFSRAFKGLEDEVDDSLSYQLVIVLPYPGVKRGDDWSKSRSALKSWITEESYSVSAEWRRINDVPGLPEFKARKSTGGRPGLLLSRSAPSADTLAERLGEQILRKANKLSRYQLAGKTTVLLLENCDGPLMNDGLMLENLDTSLRSGLPASVDELWYADTCNGPNEVRFLRWRTEHE